MILRYYTHTPTHIHQCIFNKEGLTISEVTHGDPMDLYLEIPENEKKENEDSVA